MSNNPRPLFIYLGIGIRCLCQLVRRKDIEGIILNEAALTCDPEYEALSPQEKAIAFLIKEDFNKEEISAVLNTSVAPDPRVL
ncbi:MAG: hypothetical protein WC166_02360 [Bacteroidales bacterium]